MLSMLIHQHCGEQEQPF